VEKDKKKTVNNPKSCSRPLYTETLLKIAYALFAPFKASN